LPPCVLWGQFAQIADHDAIYFEPLAEFSHVLGILIPAR
jgi:hypothetical protein